MLGVPYIHRYGTDVDFGLQKEGWIFESQKAFDFMCKQYVVRVSNVNNVWWELVM